MSRFASTAFLFLTSCHTQTTPTPTMIVDATPTATASTTSTPPQPSATAAATGSCSSGRVTVNGAPFVPRSMRAYGFPSPNEDAYVLLLSSKDVSCAQLVSGSRPVTKDETYVEVGVGANASAQQFVVSQNETAKVATDLVKRPVNPGDPIEVCVRAPAHLETSMVSKQTIEVVGSLSGTYCGKLK